MHNEEALRDALTNIKQGSITRTCTRYDVIQTRSFFDQTKAEWNEVMQVINDNNLEYLEFYTLNSKKDNRWLNYHYSFILSNEFDEMASYSSQVFFPHGEQVITDIVNHVEYDSEQAEYEKEHDFLLLSPILLLGLGFDKSFIRKQFDYLVQLLRCNREAIKSSLRDEVARPKGRKYTYVICLT